MNIIINILCFMLGSVFGVVMLSLFIAGKQADINYKMPENNEDKQR